MRDEIKAYTFIYAYKFKKNGKCKDIHDQLITISILKLDTTILTNYSNWVDFQTLLEEVHSIDYCSNFYFKNNNYQC